jgi:hypothetical protein
MIFGLRAAVNFFLTLRPASLLLEKVSPGLSRWVRPGVSPLFGRPYDRCGDTGGN